MKILALLTVIVAGFGLAGCHSPTPPKDPGAVTVDFQNPDNFRDVRESLGGGTDENALAALRTYLQETAPTYLQSGQKLHVTFTDIDLAGDFPVSAGGKYDRVRLIRSIYIPRQEFTFELTDASGARLKQGKRTLMDMNFQAAGVQIGSDQPYFYDKMLLKDWLRKEFR